MTHQFCIAGSGTVGHIVSREYSPYFNDFWEVPMIAKARAFGPWIIGTAILLVLVFFTQLKLYAFGLLIFGTGYFIIQTFRTLDPQQFGNLSHWKAVGMQAAIAFAMFFMAGALTMIGPVPTFPDSSCSNLPGKYDISC
jgi:hypothetical protein